MLIQEAEHLLNSVIRIVFNNTVSLTKTELVSDPANTLRSCRTDDWWVNTGVKEHTSSRSTYSFT